MLPDSHTPSSEGVVLSNVLSRLRLLPRSRERAELVSFLKKNSVIRGEDERIVSPSGGALKWLLDTRVALLNPVMSRAISALFWDALKDAYPFQMCCLELTGIPLMMGVQGFAMTRGFQVNGFIIRKEPKPTGRQRQIEGTVNELPIVFLDDIINSGDSIERAVLALGAVHREVTRVVALVDFGTDEAAERLIRRGVHLRSLIELNELGITKGRRREAKPASKQMFDEMWAFKATDCKTSDVVPKSSPAIDEANLYFGTDSGAFYALALETGTTLWRFLAGTARSKGIRSSPEILGPFVYFGAYDGVFYCLDKLTGRLVWQFMEADWIGSSPCFSEQLGLLFVGLEYASQGSRGGLVALSARDGEKAWEFAIPGLVHSSPCCGDNPEAVFVGSNNGALYCVYAATGVLRWSADTGGPIKSRPRYDATRGLVLAGSFDKSVYAWKAGTGELVWRADTSGVIYSEPLVVGDQVFVCSTDKYFYVLNIDDGSIDHCLYIGAKLFSSPIRCNDKVYFAATSGYVYEYDIVERALTGTHVLPDRITTKLAYDSARKVFYVATVNDQVIACRRC